MDRDISRVASFIPWTYDSIPQCGTFTYNWICTNTVLFNTTAMNLTGENFTLSPTSSLNLQGIYNIRLEGSLINANGYIILTNYTYFKVVI